MPNLLVALLVELAIGVVLTVFVLSFIWTICHFKPELWKKIVDRMP